MYGQTFGAKNVRANCWCCRTMKVCYYVLVDPPLFSILYIYLYSLKCKGTSIVVQLHWSSRSMVFRRKIAEKTRAYIYLLRMEGGLSLRQISRRCQVSASSVLRICREGILAKDKGENSIKILKTGRPCIFTDSDRSRFLRKFLAMREENLNVTVLEVGREAGMTHVSRRTLIRAVNKASYYRLTAIRKGVLSVEDGKTRVKFARDALKDMIPEFEVIKSCCIWMVFHLFTKVTHTEKRCQRKGRCIEEKMKDLG